MSMITEEHKRKMADGRRARKGRVVIKPGFAEALNYELDRSRENLVAHQYDAARPYWLGVVDGLVFAMSLMGLPTSPSNNK